MKNVFETARDALVVLCAIALQIVISNIVLIIIVAGAIYIIKN